MAKVRTLKEVADYFRTTRLAPEQNAGCIYGAMRMFYSHEEIDAHKIGIKPAPIIFPPDPEEKKAYLASDEYKRLEAMCITVEGFMEWFRLDEPIPYDQLVDELERQYMGWCEIAKSTPLDIDDVSRTAAEHLCTNFLSILKPETYGNEVTDGGAD